MLTIDPDKILADAMQKAKDCFTVGDLDYAKEILEQVLRCEPNHQAALQLLGVFFWRTKKYEEARTYFIKSIDLDKNNPDNWNNLALCTSCLGKLEEAIEHLKMAINLDPFNSKYYNNLAIQYRQQGNYEAALESLKKAVSISPEEIQIWINLGGIYGESHRLDEAEVTLNRALELDPENANVHVDLAYTHALQRRYDKVWSNYEYRFNHFENLWPYNNKYNPLNRLTNAVKPSSLHGQTVIIYCEQGVGDAINFIRYVPHFKAKFGCRVILHCSPLLKSLFENQPHLGIDEIITDDIVLMKIEDLPSHDCHTSIMSLPYLLEMEIPPGGYIAAPEKADLGSDDQFKIGICWAGSPLHPHDRIRSCHLKHFKKLHDIPGVKLFSLQQNISPRIYTDSPHKSVDYTEGAEDMTIYGLSEYMTDFESTAKILTDLDLVVSVDTSLLHLAGAMGVPTLGLIAYNPDWRWGIDGEDTPWYSSVNLVRQQSRGDWSGVFDYVIEKVKNMK